MLIDCHTHLNNYHEGEPRPTEENAQDLIAKMDERGVDHAVVITSYKVDDSRPSVEKVLSALANNPRTTIVEGLRWKGEDRTDLFAMEERIRDGMVGGLKLYPGYEPYPINDASLEPVFEVAARRKVPVMIHTGDTYSRTAQLRNAHPLLVDDVAIKFPEVNFIMCHCGCPWFMDAAEVMYKNENVYGDISGLALGEFEHDFEEFTLKRLKEMILHMGQRDDLLYGSDWPLVRMGPYVDFFEKLELSEGRREAMAWKTAAKLFHIDVDSTKRAVEEAKRGREREVEAEK